MINRRALLALGIPVAAVAQTSEPALTITTSSGNFVFGGGIDDMPHGELDPKPLEREYRDGEDMGRTSSVGAKSSDYNLTGYKRLQVGNENTFPVYSAFSGGLLALKMRIWVREEGDRKYAVVFEEPL